MRLHRRLETIMNASQPSGFINDTADRPFLRAHNRSKPPVTAATIERDGEIMNQLRSHSESHQQQPRHDYCARAARSKRAKSFEQPLFFRVPIAIEARAAVICSWLSSAAIYKVVAPIE